MSYYELLLFVHILMAVTWVGGAIAIQILAFRILRENDANRLASFSHDAGFLGQNVFTPASLVLVVAGILMVLDAGWEFSDLWIVIGIIGFLATVITGVFYLTPTSKKLGALLEQRGPSEPEVRSIIERLLAISRVDLVVLIIVIFVMAVKPGS